VIPSFQYLILCRNIIPESASNGNEGIAEGNLPFGLLQTSYLRFFKNLAATKKRHPTMEIVVKQLSGNVQKNFHNAISMSNACPPFLGGMYYG